MIIPGVHKNENLTQNHRQHVDDAVLRARGVHFAGERVLVGDNAIEFRSSAPRNGIQSPHITSFYRPAPGTLRAFCSIDERLDTIRAFTWEALGMYLLTISPGPTMRQLYEGKGVFAPVTSAIMGSETVKKMNLAISKRNFSGIPYFYPDSPEIKWGKATTGDIEALKAQLELPSLFARFYAFYMDPSGTEDMLSNGARRTNFFFARDEISSILDAMHATMQGLLWVPRTISRKEHMRHLNLLDLGDFETKI